MKKELFESILREGSGMAQVTLDWELDLLLAMNCDVIAKGTGPFGEDKGAKVVAYGDIADNEDVHYNIEIGDDELEEFGYSSKSEYIEDFAGTEVIVLDHSIGQSDSNFYMLDARSISDCDLWASTADIERCHKIFRRRIDDK